MKSWKTTLFGCGTAAAYAALTAVQNGNLEPKDLAIIAGFAALGYFSKSINVEGKEKKDVTGGTKQQ